MPTGAWPSTNYLDRSPFCLSLNQHILLGATHRLHSPLCTGELIVPILFEADLTGLAMALLRPEHAVSASYEPSAGPAPTA